MTAADVFIRITQASFVRHFRKTVFLYAATMRNIAMEGLLGDMDQLAFPFATIMTGWKKIHAI
jgi:hypothetical protein